MTDETTGVPEAATDRRGQIAVLTENALMWDAKDSLAKANVLALLEIADAIDRLAAEIEKVGWAKK